MRTVSQDAFNEILSRADITPRLKRELKFVKSVDALTDDWSQYELVAISDRTNNKGVLLLEPEDNLFVVQYELTQKIIDAKTGRGRAVICDFCYTWQPGANAASILFTKPNSKHKVGFLCCGDLACSEHVRTLTKAARMSRAQLRESLTDDDRVERLKSRLADKIRQLELIKVDM
jgi:hypothetical protein